MSTGFYLLDHHVSRNIPRKDGKGRPWYMSRAKPLQFGVIHTAENLPDFRVPDLGAEAVAKYGATTERASWHDTVDSDSWIRMLPHSYTAFHVIGYNSPSAGLEIATQAAKWVDTPLGWRLAILENTAAWVAYCHQAHGFPIVLLTKAQVDAGTRGFTYHSRLDPTRRSDPGDAFPWSWVETRAKALVAAAPPPPVSPIYVDRNQWAPWAEASIENMIESGILRGTAHANGTMTFDPKKAVTREELAVALDRLEKRLT